MSDSIIDSNSEEPPISSADYNDQLADKITTLAGQINAANYRFLKLIAEFDRREGWAGFGIRSCAHWLNWKCSIGMTAAREKVRTARALDCLPGINAGFEKGELSFSKVRAMTRVATKLNEPFLLMIAEYGTAQHMEKLVNTFRTVTRCDDGMNACVNDGFNTALNKALDKDSDKDEFGRSEAKREQDLFQLQQENRTVICYQDDDGMWTIQAKLPAEEGSLLVKVLKELGDQIAYPTAAEEPSLSMGAAEAKSVTAVTPSNETTSFIPDKLTFPQRRADALVALTEHYLASSTASSVPSLKPTLSSLKAAERCQLVLHVHAGDDSNLSANLDASLEGRWLLPEAAKRLACDASLLVVKEDSAGNILDIGRKTRIIPPAISRALDIRDGGCQFPGCCESRYVEGHHIKHWADGGETKLDNLVTLCKYHHRELHKGAFYLCLKPEQLRSGVSKLESSKPERFADRLCFSKVDRYFDSPLNRSKDFVIATNPAKFTCACHSFSELEKTLNGELSEPITEKTAVTKWTGERMDLSMTIDGLMNYQPKTSSPPLRGI
ncbi:MAG: DUF222 domain-containing protein [Oleispira sp.]|nr:DUF222 domain-containing protein [Oleispira sp.]MBL4882120.1 DUF222 domain-containing protein [Oleispira sp.]